jgi:PhoH-like ATPase
MNEYVSFDTNVLIDYPECIEEFDKIFLNIVVIQELDKLKNDKEIGYRARKALKLISKNINKIKVDLNELLVKYNEHNDDIIIKSSYNNDCLLYSNDLAVRLKAGFQGVPTSEYTNDCEIYKGYKIFNGSSEEINNLFIELEQGINSLNLIQNEYVLFTNTDTDTKYELRFDKGKLVEIKLPPSKVIKGLNAQQRCALDLLNNKDIPIKVIAGTYGSGKTLLAVKMGMYHTLSKENYKSILFLRNPVPDSDSGEIGFLPGDKNEKIRDYCKPFFQYIENESQINSVESLLMQGKIQVDVVSFLKGVNIDDTFVICDEAEDLNSRLLKRIGTRIAKKACIVFTGDWEQCESRYKNDNGLLKLIEYCKGNDLVGIVVLDEDVRSSASKVFADLK